MYVCNTKKGDVRNAMKDMVKNHKEWKTYAGPLVLQVSMKEYKHLKTNASPAAITERVEKKEAGHIINPNTLTVHKKDCKHAGKATLTAILLNVKNTGLRICKHC